MITQYPSLSEIQAALDKNPKARRIAVENFVLTCPLETPDNPRAASNARLNLAMDARLYKWNAPTQNLIRKLLAI